MGNEKVTLQEALDLLTKGIFALEKRIMSLEADRDSMAEKITGILEKLVDLIELSTITDSKKKSAWFNTKISQMKLDVAALRFVAETGGG